ncbi:MAG: response regulator [Myxococcota bacterium]
MSAGRSILLVDDDPQLLRLMTRLLEKSGHVVRSATSAVEALTCFEDGPPGFELAILDVNLAAGGGAEALLPELRARIPELEVVLISGDVLPASLEQALATRGGRFLRKPFAPSALLALVAEADGGKAGA